MKIVVAFFSMVFSITALAEEVVCHFSGQKGHIFAITYEKQDVALMRKNPFGRSINITCNYYKPENPFKGHVIFMEGDIVEPMYRKYLEFPEPCERVFKIQVKKRQPLYEKGMFSKPFYEGISYETDGTCKFVDRRTAAERTAELKEKLKKEQLNKRRLANVELWYAYNSDEIRLLSGAYYQSIVTFKRLTEQENLQLTAPLKDLPYIGGCSLDHTQDCSKINLRELVKGNEKLTQLHNQALVSTYPEFIDEFIKNKSEEIKDRIDMLVASEFVTTWLESQKDPELNSKVNDVLTKWGSKCIHSKDADICRSMAGIYFEPGDYEKLGYEMKSPENTMLIRKMMWDNFSKQIKEWGDNNPQIKRKAETAIYDAILKSPSASQESKDEVNSRLKAQSRGD